MTIGGSEGTTRGTLRLYRDSDGPVEVQVRLEQETLWLSQREMAALFEKDNDTIGIHLRNIYLERELDEAATTEDSSVVQMEGTRRVRRRVRLYNLDAILSVGYRVSSRRGTQFRIWATSVLRDHLVRGYTAHAARLRELEQAVRIIADTARQRATARATADLPAPSSSSTASADRLNFRLAAPQRVFKLPLSEGWLT